MLEITTKITDKDLEVFAKRVLPVIEQFYMDESNQKEFEEWKAKQKKNP